MVLGYTRLLWLRFYPRKDMRTLIRGLEAAFRFFGGVPREMLFDQMKSVITRDDRLQAAMRSSRLPAVNTLKDFDFSFQPSIKREQGEDLHELHFLERKEKVVFLGPPGVG